MWPLSTYPSVDSSSGPVGVSNKACGDHLYHDRRIRPIHTIVVSCVSRLMVTCCRWCARPWTTTIHSTSLLGGGLAGSGTTCPTSSSIRLCLCLSLSPLHSKCSTLRDLNIVRPNRTELRMAQDAQLPPPLDDLSLAKVARAASPSSPCTCLPIYT